MTDSDHEKIQQTVNYYDRLSNKYDKGYTAYLKHTHGKFSDRLTFDPGEQILDLSGGTGILAEKILKKFPEVHITLNDPSGGMLKIAKNRLRKYAQVNFTNFPAEEIPFEENRFDHILCLNSFHYYTKQHFIIDTMRKILKPVGTIKILDWNREGWFYLPNAIISLLSSENIHTLSLAEIKNLLTESGFEIQTEECWSYRFWKFFYVDACTAVAR